MKFKTRRRVEFANTDAAGIVHFAAFFLWMESAEHEALRDVGVEILPREPGKVTWPRVSVKCDYHAAARFEDLLEIDVSVSKIGRSSVEYLMEFWPGEGREPQKKIATGRITSVCCYLRKGGGLEKSLIPESIRVRLQKLT